MLYFLCSLFFFFSVASAIVVIVVSSFLSDTIASECALNYTLASNFLIVCCSLLNAAALAYVLLC